MIRTLLGLLALVATSALLAGCGGATASTTEPPESASLAPADALLYATVNTDEGSDQWKQAESLLERIPGARDGLVSAVSSALHDQSLSWEDDVAPAIGPEVVVVVTGGRKPVVLTKPESEAKLDALLAKGDTTMARDTVDGWTALAQQQADLVAYRASLKHGSLRDVEAFQDGFAALPAEGIARVWVDVARLSKDLGDVVAQASSNIDLGLDWLSASVSAEDDGALVSMGMRTPGGGDTSYEPELFDRVPADAVAALSFGGTQSTLDRIERSVDVDKLSSRIEKVTGVSLDGLVHALSGEGVLYVRKGENVPEVTLVLAPPDAGETWEDVNRLAKTLATESGGTIRATTENGLDVRQIVLQDVTISYARLDADTIIVTTGPEGIRLFTGDGEKLGGTEGYTRAAEAVGLEGRTRGFVYVDVDGVLSLVEGIAGEDGLPPDAHDAIGSIDSFILQANGSGDTTKVSGFVRLNG